MDNYPIYTTNYPKLLTEIQKQEKDLYLRGSFPNEKDFHFLTIVGTRRITEYGIRACREIIEGLRDYPFVIVSGLALGTDTLVHQLALENRLPTIAVLGSGLDDSVIYPRSNVSLAHHIIQQGGALLSPFLPKFKATPWSFPVRNQIMAGLSHAIVVIEAENKSGSRITASLATRYNREVFAIPGSIFSELSIGTNELIREGATPIHSAKDILEYFGYEDTLVAEKSLDHLTKKQQSILSLLTTPQSRDQLFQKIDTINMPELLIELSTLEIYGYIREHGGIFSKI